MINLEKVNIVCVSLLATPSPLCVMEREIGNTTSPLFIRNLKTTTNWQADISHLCN